jgi:hypothetical protein
MATVNFNCERCGKLMAVSEEHLGKSVRCPHCQEIIQAPGQPPGPAPASTGVPSEPVFTPPQAVFTESIFEEMQQVAGDDLFVDAPRPVVELPPVPNPIAEIPLHGIPPPAPPPADGPALADSPTVSDLASPPPPEPPTEATVTYLDLSQVPVSGAELRVGQPPAPLEMSTPAPVGADGVFTAAPGSEVGLAGDALAGIAAPPRPARTRASNLVPTLLIFLIPYSIVVTIAAVMLYFRLQEKFDPLELLPDPKPTKKEGGADRRKVRIDWPLSDRLLVHIGAPIRIGDLEVTPRGVARTPNQCLALTVKLRNLSGDVDFNPVDPDFTSYDRMAPTAPRPYTYLEIGNEKVYGGDWIVVPRDGSQRLKPGEEMTAVLVTDPKDAAKIQALDQFEGRLVWRIQARRGLVSYQGKDYSTTGVVGVVFRADEVATEEKDVDGS